jgi:hypothetical protein
MTTRLIFARLVSAIMAIMALTVTARSQEYLSLPDSMTPAVDAPASAREAGRPTDPPAPPEADKTRKMELGFRYWFVNARASANSIDNGASARLGVGFLSDDSSELRYVWRFTRNNKLKFSYNQQRSTSDRADFAFNLGGDTTLSQSGIDLSQVGVADLKMRQLRIGYSWQGIRLGNNLKLGPMVELRGVLFDAKFAPNPSTTGNFVSGDSSFFGLGMLTLGADVSYAVNRRITVDSSMSLIPIAGLGRLMDLETEVKFGLSSRFNLSTGYKYQRFRVGDGQSFAQLRFRGPVAGVGFMF